MMIGDRLRQLREVKNFSQKIIEQRTGLLCCYISRLENGHTVPSIETLEKMARALEVPIYQLFYDGEEPLQVPKTTTAKEPEWTSKGKGARYFAKLRRSLGRMSDQDRSLLLHVLNKMTAGRRAGEAKTGREAGL